MKTEKTTEQQALAEKLRERLVMLKPHDTYKGKYKVDLLYIEGYGELIIYHSFSALPMHQFS